MNKVYRIVWNAASHAWVVASEFAKGRKKAGKRDRTKAWRGGVFALGMLGGVAAHAAVISTPAQAQNGTYSGTSTTSASATGGDSTAVGAAATASAQGTTAVGAAAKATNQNATAVGILSNASGQQSLALGWQATSSADYAIAVGGNANAAGAQSLALGAQASTAAGAKDAIAMGTNSKASALYATALGAGANASGDYSMALGYNASATGASGMALGNAAQAGQQGVAMGSGANATGVSSIALGLSAKAANTNGVAIGASAQAVNSKSTAIGSSSYADAGTASAGAYSATAVGTVARATGDGAVALGDSATATGDKATAVGRGAVAVGGSSALGAGAIASGLNSLAIGLGAVGGGQDSLALGEGAGAGGLRSIAIGYGAKTNSGGGQDSLAIGNRASGGGQDSIALGRVSSAGGQNSIAIGGGTPGTGNDSSSSYSGASAAGQDSIAVGRAALAGGQNSIAIGGSGSGQGSNPGLASWASGEDGIALGRGAQSSDTRNIALGALSHAGFADGGLVNAPVSTAGNTINGVWRAYAGGIADSTVSVGNGVTGLYRTVTNVAAGRVSASSTDAINGSQLYAAYQAFGVSVGGGTGSGGLADAVMYNDGTHNSVTLGNTVSTDGGRTGGTKLSNVAQGNVSSTSSDAVNGSQLHGTADSVAGALGGSSTVGSDGKVSAPSYVINKNANGTGGTTYNNVGDAINNIDARTTTNTTNIAGNTTNITKLMAGTAGLVQQSAAGANLTVGKDTDGVAVDFADKNGQTRTLKNIMAGVADSDAVNMSQLKSTGLVDGSGNVLNVVTYDSAAKGSITLGGTASTDGGTTGGTRISNLTQGALSATSTDAVNGSQLYATNQLVNNINNGAGIKYFHANSTKDDSSATGPDAIAVGPKAIAAGNSAIAMGNGAQATTGSGKAIAIGTNALANSGISIGEDTKTAASQQIAIGPGATISDTGGAGVVLGALSTVTGNSGVAIGYLTQANAQQSIAMGTQARTDPNTTASVAMGYRAGALAGYSVVVGPSASTTSDGQYGTALGNSAKVSAIGGVAVGSGAAASQDNSVALGRQSTTLADLTQAAYAPSATTPVAGLAPFGEVSVGAAGKERRITNVAAGAALTDAVNVSQLQSLDGKVDGIATGTVQYDRNADGTVNTGSVTLAGTGGTKISNVAKGQADSDAVNVSQLKDSGLIDGSGNTQKAVLFNGANGEANVAGQKIVNVAAGEVSSTSTDAVNGSQLHGTADSVANALGGGAGVNADGTVSTPSYVINKNVDGSGGTTYNNVGDAITNIDGRTTTNTTNISNITNQINNGTVGLVQQAGAGAKLTVGKDTDGVAVDFADKDGQTRTLKNVSAGSEDTDAVNMSQLKNTGLVDGNGNTLNAVAYDDTTKGHITLGGTTSIDGGKTGGTRISNLAQGALGDASTEAVNGSQLYETNQQVATNTTNITNLGDTINNIAGDTSTTYVTNNGSGIKYARTNDTGLAQGDAHATVAGATALGYEATASHGNSVALGANSRADGSSLGDEAYLVGGTAGGEVSVGASGNTRRITNVAAGANDTDAVNVAQLKSVASASVADAVMYDDATHSKTTLGGAAYNSATGTGGTTISNVAKGQADSDAVNVAQLKDAGLIDGSGNTQKAVLFNGPNGEANVVGQKIVNVAAGEVSATSTDAVNGAQLNDTNNAVAGNTTSINKLVAGAVQYDKNPDGTVNTGSVTLAGTGGTKITNVAKGQADSDAVNVSQLKDSGLIDGSGNTQKAVLFNGANGEANVAGQKIVNVAAGEVSSTSTDAMNGSQLHGTADSVANALGGGAGVNADGTVSTPSYVINKYADGTGGTTYNNVGDAITNIDGRTTTNTTNISNITNQINNGTVGLVQQSGAGANLTVGKDTDGVAVDFADKDGQTRTLKNVSAGSEDTDAVNMSQLKNTGLVDGNGNTLNAVTYDDATKGSVTLGGLGATTPVKLKNVADGTDDTDAVNMSQLRSTGLVDGNGSMQRAVLFNGPNGEANVLGQRIINLADGAIAAGSRDAVNGGQIAALSDSLQSQITGLGNQVTNIDNRVTNIEGNGGGGVSGLPYVDGNANGSTLANANAGDTAGVAVGYNANAAGENASVLGQNATALGNYGTAIGNDSYAAGPNDTALGGNAKVHADGSVAVGANATVTSASATNAVAIGADTQVSAASGTAIGQGASVTSAATGSVALGQGAVADRANTVSVGTAGGERQITNVQAGVQQTDAVNVSQLQGVTSALGGGSTVSNGSVTAPTYNVAGGSYNNVGDALQGIDSKLNDQFDRMGTAINKVNRDANRGIASAAALVNSMPYIPGKITVNAGVAGYRGQSAIGVGVSRWSTDGRVNVNAGVSSSGGAPIVRFGVGLVLGD